MDEDLDISLEETVTSNPETDELLRYLDEEEDTDSDESKERLAREEEERLQAIVDRKLADRFVNQPSQKYEPPVRQEPAAPTPNPQDLLEKMADEVVNDFAVDPKAAIKKMLAASRAMATEQGETATARANRLAIEQYRASKRDDPMFKAIEEDFDKEVSTYTEAQLGRATPAQVRRALEIAEDAAIGRYYRNQLTEKKKRAANPPAYGGGSGSPSSRGFQSRTLSNSQRELIRMAKSAGLDDKAIKELVRENS